MTMPKLSPESVHLQLGHHRRLLCKTSFLLSSWHCYSLEPCCSVRLPTSQNCHYPFRRLSRNIRALNHEQALCTFFRFGSAALAASPFLAFFPPRGPVAGLRKCLAIALSTCSQDSPTAPLYLRRLISRLVRTITNRNEKYTTVGYPDKGPQLTIVLDAIVQRLNSLRNKSSGLVVTDILRIPQVSCLLQPPS